MGDGHDGVKQILAKSIHLADQVVTGADGAHSYRQECAKVKTKAERLAALLRQVARATDLYERPARRIFDDTEQVLDKALSLVSKCRPIGIGLMKRVFFILPTAFDNMSTQLENSIADVSWLFRAYSLRTDANGDDSRLLGLPPIAKNKPIILFLIWEHIAILHTGSLDARSNSAATLASLARDNARVGKLIIEEDGVGPLLRLVREGPVEGQENAARALGILGRDLESVEPMLHAGVCPVFAKVLKDGPLRAQAMAAWAVAELTAVHPKFKDLFAQNNVVRLLVDHLASEPVYENRNYFIDPADNDHMKSMAARALWQLAKSNPAICKSITDSKALLCFAMLLERSPNEEARQNSAMALMEIARVAEHHYDIRRSAFRPNTPAARAVIDQLLRVIENADRGRDGNLLLPCITALGCLSQTFRQTEMRVIAPLVRLLNEDEELLSREAAIALTKFAGAENNLHVDNSRAIIEAGGLEHLVQLAYLAKKVQIEALVLLCSIALHVPDSEELAKAGVLSVLGWASMQVHLVQDTRMDSLLPEAKVILLLYQSKISVGFH